MNHFSTIASIILISFLSCSQKKGSVPLINPPNIENDIPFKIYQVNTERDTTLETESGTKIRIPAHSLISRAGSDISGVIEFKVREFHHPMAILQSGISMRINQGSSQILQSAGMIELRAQSNDEVLQIKNGFHISLELAGYKDPGQHSLYYLNENTGSWEVRDSFQSRKKEIQYTQNRNDEVFFDKRENQIFELFSDISVAPEMEPWLGQKWKIHNSDKSTSLEKSFRKNWDSLSIKKINRKKYILSFFKLLDTSDILPPSYDKFEVYAQPIKNSSKGETDLSLTARENKSKIIKKDLLLENERRKRESEFVNSFKINQFGVWNIDKIFDSTRFDQILTSYDFLNEIKSYNKIRIFCLYKSYNSVMEFKIGEPIRITKDTTTEFFAFLPNQNLAYVDAKTLRQFVDNRSSNFHLKTTKIITNDFFKQQK